MKDEIIELIDNWKDKHGKTDEDIERLIDSLDEDEIFIPNDEICSEIEYGECILQRMLKFYEGIGFGVTLYPNALINHYYLDVNDSNIMFIDRLLCKVDNGEMSEEDQMSIFNEVPTDPEIDMPFGWLEMMVSDCEYKYTTEEYKGLCEEVLIPYLSKCVDMYRKAFDDFDYIIDKLVERLREYKESGEDLRRLALGMKDLFEGLYIDDFTINSDGELDFYNNEDLYRDILNMREKEHER